MLFEPFLTTSTLGYYRAPPDTKNILVYDEDFVKGYNVCQYFLYIRFCSILARF